MENTLKVALACQRLVALCVNFNYDCKIECQEVRDAIEEMVTEAGVAGVGVNSGDLWLATHHTENYFTMTGLTPEIARVACQVAIGASAKAVDTAYWRAIDSGEAVCVTGNSSTTQQALATSLCAVSHNMTIGQTVSGLTRLSREVRRLGKVATKAADPQRCVSSAHAVKAYETMAKMIVADLVISATIETVRLAGVVYTAASGR